jgi:hypothetical protein
LELAVGFAEVAVFALAFVFPAEFVAPPDVGEARIAARASGRAASDGDAFLEGLFRAGGVVLGRSGVAEHADEVEEVFLRRCALGKLDARPFGDELLRAHSLRH